MRLDKLNCNYIECIWEISQAYAKYYNLHWSIAEDFFYTIANIPS